MGKRTRSTLAGPWQNGQQLNRLASVLLDQQMWCWGKDIVRSEGNLLLDFGFHKERPPANVTGCTAYILTPFPDCQLILWGFGLFFGMASTGGLFLRRFEFKPVWTNLPVLPAIVWGIDGLPAFLPPDSDEERRCTQRLLSAATKWIASYEQWVLDTVGIDYRLSCLRQWHKKIIPAEIVPDEWRQIAENCLDLAQSAENEAITVLPDCELRI